MTDKQQTAVQWLVKQLLGDIKDCEGGLIQKAFSMEREQHQRTYIHGLTSWHSDVKFEDYYKNSFNNR